MCPARSRHRARLGAHMSIAGGLCLALDRAREVDATALQIFVKSSRQWSAKPLGAAEAAEFREALEESGLRRFTTAHASYLINLASPRRDVRERSIRALADEVDRCGRLGVPALVLHPGSHLGAGEERGIDRVVRALDRVLGRGGARRRDAPSSAVSILIENTAGQGSNLGSRFEHLGRILAGSRHRDRLGVCFDTCHALAAGYDFRDRRGYRKTLAEFDRRVGLEWLRAFHFNDSKHDLGSRKDRHEHIGDGHVGPEAFRLILNDRRFRELPMILETPKGGDSGADLRNLATLRAMLPRTRR